MRIGVDIRELEKGKTTGISHYLLNFLKSAVKNKAEWEFVIFGNQDTQIDLNAPNLKKIFIREYLTFWYDQVELPRYLRKEKIDLFLTPYVKAPFFISSKLVVIINDLNPLYPAHNLAIIDFFQRIYFKSLVRIVLGRSDKILTISQYSRKELVKVFAIPKENIEVIKLSVDEKFLSPRAYCAGVLSKYGISKKFIFSISNFKLHKNIAALIEAYFKLPQKIRDEYQLVLAGRIDRECLKLKKMAGRLKLNQNLVFTDFIPLEDLPAIYRAASLFVFPSLYEGFGMPVLEAMTCGTAVIASFTTALPEVIGDAGILVNPKDTGELSERITEVLSNENLRNELITKGLKRAQNFSADELSGKILQVITETF